MEQENIEREAQEIVKEQAKVTEKIEQLAVRAARLGDRGINSFVRVCEEIVSGAVNAVDGAVPADQERALRQVFDGLSGAGKRLAHAIKLTFEEARAKSQVFSEQEIRHTRDDLAALETMAVETALKFRDKLSKETREQFDNVLSHVKNSSADLATAVREALQTVKEHPGELISDIPKSGVTLSKSIASSLLQTSADLLESAARSLKEKQD